MTATFQKASKARSKLRCALFGPAGSGKTMSALRIATGMGGRIAVIDTERGSASLYADRFEFDVLDLDNRTIDGYIEAFHVAAQGGYDVLVIDSLSHAWQELLGEINRFAQAKYGGNTWAAWSEGTPRQRRFVDALLDYPGHILATIRTKTAWDQEKDEKTGKNRPVRIGLVPEQGKGIEYEFALLMQIDTDHVVNVIKDRTGKFQDRLIDLPDEDLGRELAAWLAEGVPAPPAQPAAPPQPPALAPLPPAAQPPAQSPAQLPPVDFGRLNALVAEHGITEQQQAKWCSYLKVERIDQLSQKQVDAIISKVEATLAPPKGAY